MSRHIAVAVFSVVVLAATGCDDNPQGPSQGITVWEDPNFRGSGETFAGSVFDLDDVRGPCTGFFDTVGDGSWDDCISSIQVSPGWEVTIFEDDENEGESLTLTTDVRDLEEVRGPCGDDWDDCISSMQIRAPR